MRAVAVQIFASRGSLPQETQPVPFSLWEAAPAAECVQWQCKCSRAGARSHKIRGFLEEARVVGLRAGQLGPRFVRPQVQVVEQILLAE